MTVLLLFSASAFVYEPFGFTGAKLSNGSLVVLGNATVEVWDAPSGGSLVFAQNFTNRIMNGSFAAVLGLDANDLQLTRGVIYYYDVQINGGDLDFDDNSGSSLERLPFTAARGNSNTSLIQQNLTLHNSTLAYLLANASEQAQILSVLNSSVSGFVDSTNTTIIGNTTFVGGMDVEGSVRLNDNPLYLRTGSDTNHYLNYNSGADGPQLSGWLGSVFTATSNGEILMLLNVAGISTNKSFISNVTFDRDVRLNDRTIFFKTGSDYNHYINYTSAIDGIRVAGYRGVEFYSNINGKRIGFINSSGFYSTGDVNVSNTLYATDAVLSGLSLNSFASSTAANFSSLQGQMSSATANITLLNASVTGNAASIDSIRVNLNSNVTSINATFTDAISAIRTNLNSNITTLNATKLQNSTQATLATLKIGKTTGSFPLDVQGTVNATNFSVGGAYIWHNGTGICIGAC